MQGQWQRDRELKKKRLNKTGSRLNKPQQLSMSRNYSKNSRAKS